MIGSVQVVTNLGRTAFSVIGEVRRIPFVGAVPDPAAAQAAVGIPDPLRRIRVPKDLDAVTDYGPEEPPEAGDVSARQVEAIWSSVRDWYSSGFTGTAGVRAAAQSSDPQPCHRACPRQRAQ